MFSRSVLSIWFAAVLEVRAALTNVTLVPPSGNISLNGPLWASGASGCGDLSSAGNHHSFDFTASISVVFQGIAVYFVGMNYGPEGSIMYQASLDGVPDIQFPSYIPPQANDCGVILYSKTGIANTKHTLEIAHVPGTPHDTSLGMVGFLVTTDDGSGAPTGSSAGIVTSVTASAGTPVSSSSSVGSISPSSSNPAGSSNSNSPGSSNQNKPGSSTPGKPGSFLSRPGRVGSVVGGTIGGLIALGLAALWAHGVIQAMLGIFPWTIREFKFGSTGGLGGSHEIILTLTPVDIDKAYPCEQVVWRMFTISREHPEFTAKLEYKRAFGIAIIESGADAFNNERICKEPDIMRSAKPGRALPFTGLSWDKPLQFMLQKRTRIIARNQSATQIPQRLVIGSYIGDEVDEEKEDTIPLWTPERPARFQPFMVMEEHSRVKYGEEFSASDDLILRAYKIKTRDVKGKSSGENMFRTNYRLMINSDPNPLSRRSRR
ncbi:hypothetical protein B0H16DRAFT_783106 [Mycena metata]|uniref:Uncharacterized protein n=1 Tax=Mycena metata TaxID=1033252 RepID=A0AAD7NB83_9AGAR|nr:hypothetical protein B0H16DRAFT_783106 [Mycena metata]